MTGGVGRKRQHSPFCANNDEAFRRPQDVSNFRYWSVVEIRSLRKDIFPPNKRVSSKELAERG